MSPHSTPRQGCRNPNQVHLHLIMPLGCGTRYRLQPRVPRPGCGCGAAPPPVVSVCRGLCQMVLYLRLPLRLTRPSLVLMGQGLSSFLPPFLRGLAGVSGCLLLWPSPSQEGRLRGVAPLGWGAEQSWAS